MTDSNGARAAGGRRWIWAAVAAVVAGALVAAVAVGVVVSPPARSASAPTESSSPESGGAESSSAAPSSPAAGDDSGGDGSPTAPGAGPSEPRPTAEPVPLDQPASPSEGVSVSLESLDAFDGQASVPGEVAGPALRVTVAVRNDGAAALATGTLVVNLFYGPDRTPANILVSPRENLPEEIATGDSARGVFAFSVPIEERDDLVVEVDIDVDSSIVLFAGGI